MESLPRPKTAGYKKATIPTKCAAAQFSLSKMAMLASKGREAAWIDVHSEALSDTSEQFAQRTSQMLFRDGTGAVARVNDASLSATDTTFVVDDDQATGAGGTFGFHYLQEDMDISASADLTGKKAERNFSARITAMTDSTLTITVDPFIGDLTDNDYLFIGDKTGTSKNRDFMGLRGIVDDGTLLATLQGIDRTAVGNGFFKGNYFGSIAGQDLENKLRRANDDAVKRNQANPSTLLTGFGVFRRFSNQIISGRRFVAAAESRDYKTGVESIGWAYGPNKNIPIEVDKDCPVGQMYLLDMSSFRLGTMGGKDPSWLDDDGDVLKWDSGLLGYVAVYYLFGEFFCVAPNKNSLLDGITED
jgi:hypothetical protein